MILGGEFLESLGKRLQFSGFWIVNIEVRSYIITLEVGNSVEEFPFSGISFVKLMVARANKVNFLLLGNLICELSPRF